jgi:hypothetical protein
MWNKSEDKDKYKNDFRINYSQILVGVPIPFK